MSLWEVDDRSCRNMILVLLYKYMYMPLEQFDHVSSSTMSFNVRDNYLVGKTHLEILKCLFINLLSINSIYSIDTCIRSFRSFLFVEKKLKPPI